MTGCPFHTRCPRKLGAICERETPPSQQGPEGHAIVCHIPLSELSTVQADAAAAPAPRQAHAH
jgi:peptide/nickel transport system ATP-binding protein